jgi:anti-sigma factor RsiW
MTEEPANEGAPIDDEIVAAISDYLDGALPPDRRAEVERKVASEPDWKRAHDEISATREALSGLQKARAPGSFDQEVTGAIHRRSAGRFFGRRTLGDRVPFGVLLVIALAVLIPIAYVLWSSSTGSLKRPEREEREPAGEPRGSGQLLPKP